MTAFLILDLIIIAILIIFAALGAHRGLILSLCGLLAVLVAFVGAGFLARTLSPMVADALEPRFAAAIEEQLNEQIQNSQVQTDLTDPSSGEVTSLCIGRYWNIAIRLLHNFRRIDLELCHQTECIIEIWL